MTPLPENGRFVWYELMTNDKDAARAFYAAVFGWEWLEEDMGELGMYAMAKTGDAFHGGITSLPAPDVPSHWACYVTVPDVDRACAQATELGGQILVPPLDIPNVGRFAVIADPSGATISPFKSASPPQPEPPRPLPPGFFCWNELLTNDVAACEPFYPPIFGWSVAANEMPDLGKYWIFNRGDQMEAGMMGMPPAATAAKAPSHWLPYVSVADVDAVAAKVVALGGTMYREPTDIPQMGRFTVFADPNGAAIAAFQNA